jgi:hypothetical protein
MYVPYLPKLTVHCVDHTWRLGQLVVGEYIKDP